MRMSGLSTAAGERWVCIEGWCGGDIFLYANGGACLLHNRLKKALARPLTAPLALDALW